MFSEVKAAPGHAATQQIDNIFLAEGCKLGSMLAKSISALSLYGL